MKSLLSFETMVTPKLISVFYFLGLLLVLVSGGTLAFTSSLLGGIFFILFGMVSVRVWCEFLVVFFKMNEALQEMRKK